MENLLESKSKSLILVVSFLVAEVIHPNFLVVQLQSSKILPGLGELSLLHALPDVPVDEGPLGVHQVELVVQPGPSLGDGGGVGEHADGSLDLGQVTTRDDGWRLVVDPYLEPGGTPVHELHGPLALDGSNGRVDVLGDNITPVEETTSHVFAMAGIALDHLVGRLKAGIGNLSNR